MKMTAGYKIYQGILYTLFLLFSLACAYPFYYLIIYSLSSPADAMKYNVVLLPVGFTFSNYIRILSLPNIYNALAVSVLRVVIGTILGTLLTAMLAYVLTQKAMVFRKFFYRLIVVSMYLNAGLIPWYLTMKFLGLKNSFLLYILPYLIGAFNLILVKTFMEQLPDSLQESAEIDGARPFTIFAQIIMPICKPVLAAIIVYTAVFHWNAWTDNFYLVSKSNLQTLQMTLLNYLREANNIAQAMQSGNTAINLQDVRHTLTPVSIRITLTVFVTLPIMIVYPFMQKYFIKGMLLGAVKG
jgi:putative aldouronate transport system permease protein